MKQTLSICMNMQNVTKAVNEPFAQKWSAIRKVRSAVTTALESARNAGDIGGSLSAAVTIELSAAEHSYLAEQDCAACLSHPQQCLKLQKQMISLSMSEKQRAVNVRGAGKLFQLSRMIMKMQSAEGVKRWLHSKKDDDARIYAQTQAFWRCVILCAYS